MAPLNILPRRLTMNKKPLGSDDKLSCCLPFSRRDFAKLVLSALGTVAVAGESAAHPAEAAPEENSDNVQEGPYESVSWTVEGLGNHRVHIAVSDKADAAWVHIPWRRRDPAPELKDLLIVDARTGKQIQNVSRVNVNREFGDLVFQPLTAPGNYYVYYMPYTSKWIEVPGDWTYWATYLPPRSAADQTWLARHGLILEQLREEKWKALPQAKLLAIQACSDFDRFTRMEVIATGDETKQLLASHADRSYLLFPEDRYHPIRMTDDLPLRWIQQGSKSELHGEACIGEFYVFQVGVYAARRAFEDLSVRYGNLEMGTGQEIAASAFRCFNLGGTDWLGRPLKKTFAVAQGKVRALWFGVEIPKEAAPGDYRGTLTVQPPGSEPSQIKLSLKVKPELLNDHGDSDLWRLSRLRWLDSVLGIDDEVTAPYTPLELRGSSVHCLGREVHFAKTGFPESMRSNGREILAAPVNWVVETAAGRIPWTPGETKILKSAPGTVIRQSECAGQNLALECQAKMEFDGYINFRLRLNAKQAAQVKDIRLEIPFRKDVAAYMMGLGRKGGYRPHEWKWTWDVNHAINNVWIGDHNAGLQVKLKGPEDTWDIYDLKAAGIPSSWGNGGRGGCTVTEEDDRVVVRAYSGERSLLAGEELQFRFGLLVTPVKPLDPAHWSQRYYHMYGPPEDAARCGATIINVHQGNELNPYINYPFLTADKLAAYVSEAHNLGLKVKIYYTVRELSNRVTEMWALRSLGNEVFIGGAGGGSSWLQEHLVTDFAPAWHTPLPNGEVDAALTTTGLSRWHNYYLEGLAWLVRNVGIDGLYLDGIGYDREVMKRVRKALDRSRPGCLIDFHSGNEYLYKDLHVSPANKYMEHFPYINSLWFGEMYDYNESPDYWLVEMSGIPFGLFGEMLQDNGNPWRGMVYGMTARYYQGADPKHIWKVWDEFGIQDAQMIGYWVPGCPVKASHEGILATVYLKKRKALISIASWAKEAVACRLEIDWSALGMDPHKARLSARNIPAFQKEARFDPSAEIPIEPGRGWLLLLEEEAS
jgi:hypothetical protein